MPIIIKNVKMSKGLFERIFKKNEDFGIALYESDQFSFDHIQDQRLILKRDIDSVWWKWKPMLTQADPFLFVKGDTLYLFFEKVYAGYAKYSGALLLCKALPLDKALTKNVNPRSLFKINYQYARLVLDELDYLNQPEVHKRVVKKMMACLENKPSGCQYLRVNYQLCAHNLLPYFKLIKSEKAKELEKEKIIEQEEELVR